MRHINASRPSAAIVVGVLALVAALAGTALAGSDATTSAPSKKKVKKIAKRQAKKQIKKLAPGLSVAHAETANTANTANSATQAQNAGTANRVRPVKVNFAASANAAPRTFLNQGGVRIRGDCEAGHARLTASSTANNGTLKLDFVDGDGNTSSSPALDFSPVTILTISTLAAEPNNALTITLTYRGAGGTTVSGEVLVAEGTGAAQCVIAGTLFVA
jgi:hypothetical protein